MTTLVVGNNGPDIRSTNYWQSEYAKGGIVFLSMTLQSGSGVHHSWYPGQPPTNVLNVLTSPSPPT